MYKITIGSSELGYINEKQNLNDYIDSIIEKEKNIAFIDLKETVQIKLELVNRDVENSEDKIKKGIKENITVQYTTYAITCEGINIAYVSTKEEAEQTIQNLEEYDEKLGILQVYSEEYNNIAAIDIKEAENEVIKAIQKKSSTNTVKIAKANSKGSIQGVKFTVKPISGTITSRFGGRTSPGGIGSTNHKGLDIAAKAGTAIKAAAAGTVTFAGYKGSLGNLIMIDNGNGVETYYAHCSKLYVSKGQKVKAGDKIAAVGQTGTATGPHLHLEIHVNGKAVNPQKYVY